MRLLTLGAELVGASAPAQLLVPLHRSSYSLTPTPWNGEALNVNLLKSHRAGPTADLFVEAPRIEPPRGIAGPSSHTVTIAP
jgi:hypothetical protein